MAACICDQTDSTVLGTITALTLTREVLEKPCCWKRICQVRARNFSSVSDAKWTELCRRRGYVMDRTDPQGKI